MKNFKNYIFLALAVFSLGLFFPGQNLLAAVDSCVCYEGDFELSRFTASQKSVCSDRCATLPSVTAFTFGDDSTKSVLKANAGKTGSECWCSPDTMSWWSNTADAVGTLAKVGAMTGAGTIVGGPVGFAASVAGSVVTIKDYADSTYHTSFRVGKFTSRDTCEQMCANKDYKSFVFGDEWFLGNVTYPRITPNAKPEEFVVDNNVYGTTEASGIVQCGRPGHEMCTLCDLIKGFYDIIQYIIKISVVVALAMFTLGGSSYVTSFGGEKEIEMAKAAMKNAVIGLTIILAAWLLVNTVFLILGASPNLGVSQASSWWQFECSAGGK